MQSLTRTSFAGYTFGTWYPTGYIVGLTRERSDAEYAQHALQQAGVEQVQVWTAQEVRENYAAYQEQRTFLERAASLLATDESIVQDDNLQAAERGYAFLTIPVPDPTNLNDTRRLLAAHPIRRAHYYGRYTLVDLALCASS